MKINYVFASILVLISSSLAFCELPPEQQWVANYNSSANLDDAARAVAIDNSGNVYVAGTTYDDSSLNDFALIKYDSNGNQIWIRYYDGPASDNDDVKAMTIDGSNYIYVTGCSRGSGSGDDYATIKYDQNGNQLWVSRYTAAGADFDSPNAIAVDSSGNIYVTGASYGGSSRYDYLTVKYNSSGSQLWSARYNGSGLKMDEAFAIVVDNSGNVYVTGGSDSSTGEDYATIKYNSSGTQIWVARYNWPENFWDEARAIALDNSNNVYVTGYSHTNTTGDDYVTIKYDNNGNQLWLSRYNTQQDNPDRAYILSVDNSGNSYVAGWSFGADPVLVKYDSNGNQLLVRSDPDVYYYNAMALDNQNNIYLAGFVSNDFYIIKYKSNGDKCWAKQYHGSGSLQDDETIALKLDNYGNIYITGYMVGTLTRKDFTTVKYTQHNYCTGAIAGDRDNDCKIDFTDYALLAKFWLSQNNWNDLAVLADNWLECNFALQSDCLQ